MSTLPPHGSPHSITLPPNNPIGVPAPSQLNSPSNPPGSQTRGTSIVVIQSVDDPNFPKYATVLVRDKTPAESGYSIPLGWGPFTVGGITTTSTTAVSPGSVTVTPGSMNGISVGCSLMCVNADNSNPEIVKVTATTGTTFTATFTSAKTGNWNISAGGYTYNNSNGVGGSLVLADLDARTIIGGPYGVSTVAPTPYYSAIGDHKHDGNLNPGGYINPGPIDINQLHVGALGITPNITNVGSDSASPIGSATTNITISGFVVDSVGTTSSSWLNHIFCVASIHGANEWTMVGVINPNASGIYNGTWTIGSGSLTYDLGIVYVDLVGNLSQVGVIASNLVPNVVEGITPPMPNGATFTASGVTVTVQDMNTRTVLIAGPYSGIHQEFIVNFTMGDTNTPSSSTWGEFWVPYIRLHSATSPTDPTTYRRLTPVRELATNFGNNTSQIISYGPIVPGQGYDLAASIMDSAGNETPLVQLASNQNTNPVYAGNCPFPGGYVNPDGSWSGVDGVSSSATYSLPIGSVITASADIAKQTTSLDAKIIIGNQTNGYAINFDGNSQVYIEKYVSGAATAISTVDTSSPDTNYHSYRITITVGSLSNNIEGNVDGYSFAITDSALNLTTGNWPITLKTAGSAGKVLNYTCSKTHIHYSILTPPLQGIIIPPWINTPSDGSTLASGLASRRHIITTQGGNMIFNPKFLGGTGSSNWNAGWQTYSSGVAASWGYSGYNGGSAHAYYTGSSTLGTNLLQQVVGANTTGGSIQPVYANQTYTFSCEIAAQYNGRGWLQVQTQSGTQYNSNIVGPAQTGLATITFTCGASDTWVEAKLVMDNNGTTGTAHVYFYNPQFEQGGFATPYNDNYQSGLVSGTHNPNGGSGLDGILDGITYGRPLSSRLSSGKPWIDFSESIHANKNLGNIPDDSGSSRFAVSNIDANRRAIIDFASAHLNNNMDYIHTGGSYGRILLTEIAGSGTVKQLNDGTNVRTAANVAAVVNSSGYIPSSTSMNSQIPNSSAFFTDFTWHFYFQSGSPDTLTIWYDNGSGGDSYIYLPNYTTTVGDRDINLSHTTQTSYTKQYSGISIGSSVFCLAYYQPGTGLITQFSITNWPVSTLRTVVQDGGYIAAYAIAGTGSTYTVPSTTGGASVGGNGGKIPLK